MPIRFVLDATPQQAAANFIPIVIAGSVKGADDAAATWRRVLGRIPELHRDTAAHYRAVRRTHHAHRDCRSNSSTRHSSWAKVGIDKGIATNPSPGPGLVAGFRTSGDSERPGFAWFFGRDSLWTALAINLLLGFAAIVGTALDFLKKFQREDGKIPHEISQSAALIPWFKEYTLSVEQCRRNAALHSCSR